MGSTVIHAVTTQWVLGIRRVEQEPSMVAWTDKPRSVASAPALDSGSPADLHYHFSPNGRRSSSKVHAEGS